MAINFSDEDRKNLENDKSEIYTKRTEESYAEYAKKLKGRNKGRYFADYYLGFVIIAVIVIVLLVFFVRDAVAIKPSTVLSVAIDGDAIDDGQLAEFEKTIADVLELDTKREKVHVYISIDEKELQTFLYTGETDVVISSEDGFKKWAESGYFLEPGSESELAFYNSYPEDEKYYSEYISADDIRNSESLGQIEASDTTKYNFGIYLTSTDKYAEELGGLIQKPVAGISAASENVDYASVFIQYMTGLLD